MTTDPRSERVTDPDGAAVEILALPTDEGSLEELLRDLFEKHWDEITFGPLIQGGAKTGEETKTSDSCSRRKDPP